MVLHTKPKPIDNHKAAPPILIMIHGGKKESVEIAAKADWYYGYQYGSTCYGLPYMADYVGDGSDWKTYLDTLKHERPRQVVVADFRHSDEWREIQQRMIDVAELGIRPVVVAKHSGALRLIPQTVLGIKSIVGVSVPVRDGYMDDGFMPLASEFVRYSSDEKRDIHLLGGHPDQWTFLRDYYQDVANTYSIDGNVLYRVAREYGKMWSRHGHYREMRGQGYSTEALTICSMRNARRWLANNHPTAGERVWRCAKQLSLYALPKVVKSKTKEIVATQLALAI